MNVACEPLPIPNYKLMSRNDSRRRYDERRAAILIDTRQMMTSAFMSSSTMDEPGFTEKQQKGILPVSPNDIAAYKVSEIEKDLTAKECKNKTKKDKIVIGKDSWLCAYLEMKRKQERKLRSQQLQPVDIHEDDKEHILLMMQTYKTTELREKLHILQCQLYSYHNVADQVEELKGKNQQLEDKVSQLEEEDTKKKQVLKKRVKTKLRALKREIEQLKLDLAQSRSKEDHHKEEMSKICNEKDCLEKEIDTLRLEKSPIETTCTNDDKSQSNIGAFSRLRDQLLTSFSARSVTSSLAYSEDDTNFHDSLRSCPESFNTYELDRRMNVYHDEKL